MRNIRIAVILLLVFQTTCGFKYMTSNEIINLLHIERTLIEKLEMYISEKTIKLQDYTKKIQNLHHSRSMISKTNEFGHNILHSFQVIKHLAYDFEKFTKELTRNEEAISKVLKATNLDELHHKMHSFINNNMQNIINIKGWKFGDDSLSIEDKFHIAKICALNNNYNSTISWLTRQNISQLELNKRLEGYEKLFLGFIYSGDLTSALFTVIISLDYQWDYGNRYALLVSLREKTNNLHNAKWAKDLIESYKICAGDYNDEIVKRGLKCSYRHYNNPYLKLGPFKYEELSKEPLVYIVHDAISDSEIETMKQETVNKLSNAQVQKDGGKENVRDLFYRPCETTFHNARNHEKMLLRLEHATGISRFNGEMLSILHYSPGGYYRPHSDYLGKETPSLEVAGNRIATALFYCNDVELGGETVIIDLKLRVKPTKGSVLFWLDMTKDRKQEDLTIHAACPVIYGEKFGATQWIRETGVLRSVHSYNVDGLYYRNRK